MTPPIHQTKDHSLQRALVRLHDAELIAIDVHRNECKVSMRLRLPDGHATALNFGGVVAFRITDFVLQNVVSRLQISSVASFSDDQIGHWIRWADSFSDAPSAMTNEAVGRHVDRIRCGELLLCVLEPSRGAEAGIICESVSAETEQALLAV